MTDRDRFQYEHIVSQIVKEAYLKDMDPERIVALIADEIRNYGRNYIEPWWANEYKRRTR